MVTVLATTDTASPSTPDWQPQFGFCRGTRRHQNTEYHRSHRLAHRIPIPRPHQDATRSGTKAGPLCDHPRDARLLRCTYVVHYLSFIKGESSSWKRFPSWLPQVSWKIQFVVGELIRLLQSSHIQKTPSRPWPQEPTLRQRRCKIRFQKVLPNGPDLCRFFITCASSRHHYSPGPNPQPTAQSPSAQGRAGNDR